MADANVKLSATIETVRLPPGSIRDLANQINTAIQSGAALSPKQQLFYQNMQAQGLLTQVQAQSQAAIQMARIKVPPMLAQNTPPKIPQPIDWKMVGMAGLLAPMSPWVAARALSQSGLFGRLFGNMGGGGGIWGSGGFRAFFESFVAMTVITRSLTLAFNQLKLAVESGSKLYQDSARTARPMAQLFQLQTAFSAIGMSPDAANRMLTNMQFTRGRGQIRGLGAMTGDQMFGALRASGVGEMGDMQQLVNMSREFKEAWDAVAQDAQDMAMSAKTMQEISGWTKIIKADWEALVNQIVSVFGPELVTLMQTLHEVLRDLNNQLRTLLTIRSVMAAFQSLMTMSPKKIQEAFGTMIKNILGIPSAPGDARIGGPYVPPQTSAWERMGLIINGGVMGRDYARQTAENTRRIADAVTQHNRGSMFQQFIPNASAYNAD